MKKWLVLACAIFAFSGVDIRADMYGVTLAAKVITEGPNGYFVLSDGSHWKVMGFVPRMRGLSEWWNDVQLAPVAYKCSPNDWVHGTLIVAYPKYGNLEANESNASNQEALQQCPYLLENRCNGQVLFAMPLDPAQCLVQLHQDAYQSGYDQGYQRGHVEGSFIRQHAFEEGYEKGYVEGHEVGYSKGYQTGYTTAQANSDTPQRH